MQTYKLYPRPYAGEQAIYLLKRRQVVKSEPPTGESYKDDPTRVDEARAFVVKAFSASEARKHIARVPRRRTSKHYGDEGPEVWMDAKKTSCTLIGYCSSYSTKPAIILRDFNNG